MLNNLVVKSSDAQGICITLLAVLAVVSGLASCGGATGKNSNNDSGTPAPIVLPSTIAAEAKKCADEPMRGTVYYYCDCKAGAALGCQAGNDGNTGTDPAAPRQTLGNATARISGFTDNTNHTIAFCKGGSFTSVAPYGEYINRSGCTAGTDCDDMREYASPDFTSSAAPILNSTVASRPVLMFSGNVGGVRILNLAFNSTTAGSSWAVQTIYNSHDITACNNNISNMAAAFLLSGDNIVNPGIRIHIKGNTITNNSGMGVLGGASNSEINYNYFDGNGASNVFDHSIYISADEIGGLNNFNIVGNYIHGQHGSTCLGVVLVAHGGIDYFNITDNTISIDADKTSGGCFGIGLGQASTYTQPGSFRHTVVARNTVINGGNTAIAVANAPGAIIEDNLVMQDWAYGGYVGVSQWMLTGISLPLGTQRPQDDLSTANIVRNNTVWFGPAVLGGALGISTGDEGTGHIIANNTVVYSSASAGQGVGCYAYTLPNTSYAFINSNHCYSAATYSWRVTTDSNAQIVNDATQMSLSTWQSYATSKGWDSASIGGAPNFVNATSSTGYNFHPNTGSPLLGAGSHANAPTGDLSGTPFSNPPAIGAYE
jgi:hypothetical protein